MKIIERLLLNLRSHFFSRSYFSALHFEWESALMNLLGVHAKTINFIFSTIENERTCSGQGHFVDQAK